MILQKNILEMILNIRMHRKWFYYKNSLEMILLEKYTGNDFSYKMYLKWFYYKNA